MSIHNQQIQNILEKSWNIASISSSICNDIERFAELLYEQLYLNKQSVNNLNNKIDMSHELQKIKKNTFEIEDFRIIKEYDQNHMLIEKKGRLYLFPRQQIVNGKLRLTIIDTHSNDDYCYIFSKTLDDNFPQALVRFYLNVNSRYVLAFIKELCDILDCNEIQFSIKCFKNIYDYSRSDNTILYVYKYDWSSFFNLLKIFFKENKEQLNPNIPLFTYPICYGVGFGENPNSAGESFGSVRCRLIAKSFSEAILIGFSKKQCIEYTQNQIIEKGYDVNKFYLNPNSKYPYNFSVKSFKS